MYKIYRQTLYNCTRFKTPTSRARRCAQWAPGSCLRLVSSPTWTAQAVVGGSGHPPTAKVSCRHAKESGRRKRSRHSSPKMAARNEFRARCALLACTSHTARLAFPCPTPSSTITMLLPALLADPRSPLLACAQVLTGADQEHGKDYIYIILYVS